MADDVAPLVRALMGEGRVGQFAQPRLPPSFPMGDGGYGNMQDNVYALQRDRELNDAARQRRQSQDEAFRRQQNIRNGRPPDYDELGWLRSWLGNIPR